MVRQDEIIESLTTTYGSPRSRTKKIVRWQPHAWFAIMVQLDSQPNETVMWTPWSPMLLTHTGQDGSVLDFAEFYQAGRGRHSNTYHAGYPSLAQGQPAIRYRIKDQSEWNRLMTQIHLVLYTMRD